MENRIPAYEMPTDYMRRKLLTETIKYKVCSEITDRATGNILDARTCAALIIGDDDDVLFVLDPANVRSQLDKPEVRAELLRRWPDVRVLYQDRPRN